MEYIDKETLRNALFNGEQNLYSWEEIEAKIDALPTTEVVKCKDCLAYESADGFCNVHADHMPKDGFCSFGSKEQ